MYDLQEGVHCKCQQGRQAHDSRGEDGAMLPGEWNDVSYWD